MLVGEDRVLGHRLAAAWLEEAGERDALTLAEHFDRGQAPDRAVDVVPARRRAGARGQRPRGSRRSGASARSRSVPRGRRSRRCCRSRPRPSSGAARTPTPREAARRAMAAATPGSESWCAAAGEVVAASGKLGDRAALVGGGRGAARAAGGRRAAQRADRGDRARGHAAGARGAGRRGREAARAARRGRRRASDPAIAGWVLEARAVSAGSAGDPGARVRLADAAAESFETAGDLRNACLQRVSVGYAYNEIGAYAEAERALRGALVRGRAHGARQRGRYGARAARSHARRARGARRGAGRAREGHRGRCARRRTCAWRRWRRATCAGVLARAGRSRGRRARGARCRRGARPA